MEVVEIIKNEDGSGVFQFDFTEEEMKIFARYGIIYALKKAIEEDEFNPQEETTDEG
jgi:hypothetical protein